MTECYRCGTENDLTDYEYWGRVERYCGNCYGEMTEEASRFNETEDE